jgi:hypothetical protein
MEGRQKQHEIIIHHWCIIIPSVSTCRRCGDDLEGQTVVNPTSNSSPTSIGIVYVVSHCLVSFLAKQSVDDFCGMNAAEIRDSLEVSVMARRRANDVVLYRP